MNVRCIPKPIVNAHPPDQRPQFRVDLGRPPWGGISSASNDEPQRDASALGFSGRIIIMALRTEGNQIKCLQLTPNHRRARATR